MNRKFSLNLIFIFFIVLISTNIYAIDNDKNDENNLAEKQDSKIQNITLEDANIEKGIYKISTAIDKNQVIDVTSRSRDSGAKLELWQDKDGANQKFKIEKTSDGYYKIMALHSSKVWDISETNIEQQNNQNTISQKWNIKKDDKNNYYFVCAANNMYLEADGSSGSFLRLNNKNSNQGQKFLLTQVASLNSSNVVKDGYYIINSKLANNKVLDISGTSKEDETNIHLWTKNNGSNQVFEIKQENAGYYTINAVLSNKSLHIPYISSNKSEAKLQDSQDIDEQKWIISKTIDGNYNIISVANGLFLNVADGASNDGANIEFYKNNNTKSQKFEFEKIDIPKGSKEIEDGFYEISLQSDKNRVIDIYGNTTEEKAIAQVWPKKDGPNQRFKIKYNSNGYYTIIAVNSSLNLELYGIKAWQSKENDAMTQQWIIQSAGNGYYYIISRSNGLYLSLDGENKLRAYKKDETKNQKFKFEKLASLVGRQTIPDGYYIIESGIDSNKVIDINRASILAEENVQLWTKNARNNQKFKIEYDGKGYYTITSIRSKKVLDVAWHRKVNGSNVQQFYLSNTDWQKWIIEKTSDGYYNIISKDSGLYLNVKDGKAIDGANIDLFNKNNENNQKFKFVQTTAIEANRTISDGYYIIQSNLNTSKVLDVGGLSKNDHYNIALWNKNLGYNQRYKIIYRENGFYTIAAAHSGKAMDLSSDERNVEQDNYTGSEEQEWAIVSNGNGKYNIISAHNGLYLNVSEKNAEDGSNINVVEKNNSNNQVFSFEKSNVEEGSQTIQNGTYHIVSSLDSNKVLDVTGSDKSNGVNIELWQNNEGDHQSFNVIYQGNGYYKITAVHSSKALGVVGAGTNSPVNVNQYDTQDIVKQEWIIKSFGDGYYNIISKTNGLFMEVSESSTQNGTNIQVATPNNSKSQKFKFIKQVKKIELQSGTYGSSGLKVKGDSRGSYLRYYKIGNGPNVFFGTFAVHGWEDDFSYDGQELTKIAEAFKNKLIEMQDHNLADKWTVYIFPSVNPDGEYYGNSHNGPGRTTLYSAAPAQKNIAAYKGIDINRCWGTGFKKYIDSRNYNGTEPFQAYEARALRDFLLTHKSLNGQTILIDLHGWLNETIGDEELGRFYRNEMGLSKHIYTYGMGYLVNWARANLGSNGRTARSSLVELPAAYSSNDVLNWGLSNKYINATINMLRSIN